MTEQALRKMIAAGESTRQEFKSWVKCKDYRQRKDLAVKSAVALANTKGGVLLFGVEDDGTITGCPKSDPQALMEAIYDMTRPSLFTEIEPVETSDGVAGGEPSPEQHGGWLLLPQRAVRSAGGSGGASSGGSGAGH